MKIIGYRVNKFDTSDGHHIEGVTFYCTMNESKPKTFGLVGKKIFVSDSKISGQKYDLGMELIPTYNEYGKISSVMFK